MKPLNINDLLISPPLSLNILNEQEFDISCIFHIIDIMLLKDSFNRTIDYLRISVTDRCNLRCIYCMPAGGAEKILHKEILRYEEIARVAASAARLGIKRIRLTGGEPLIRRNIAYLIRLLKAIPGIEEISMTTNGLILEKCASELKKAGLSRVNVSLDSLNPSRYREITRGGDLNQALRAIEAAYDAGLRPVKINMVHIRGLNDDEAEGFAEMAVKTPYHIRFIEFMPVREYWGPERFIPSYELKSRIEKKFALHPVKTEGGGPASYFRPEAGAGLIGFISALTEHFCLSCNRLRLTADGRLRPCLFLDAEVELTPALRGGAERGGAERGGAERGGAERGGAGDEEIERLILKAVHSKPRGHNVGIPGTETNISGGIPPMSRIGG
jgi:cyclic pyranopterin phosphate synthase